VNAVGKVREQTVLSYAERLVVHERVHITQTACIVNTIQARKGSEDG
jgi:hypothetical protein